MSEALVSETLLQTAQDAARAAGHELVRRLAQTRDVQWKTYRGERSVVTDADFAADRAVRDLLSQRHPDHVIFSEEFPHDDILGPDVWVIDPLDGTDNYSRGQPQFCVCVAHTTRGQVDAGAVYDPIRDEMFAAASDGPATLNGQTLQVSDRDDPQQSSVVWSQRGVSEDDTRNFAAALGSAAQAFHRVRMTGSAALEIVWVAAGRYDGALFSNVKWWDIAAPSLIVSRAGGRGTDLMERDADHRSRRCVFSNGHLHAAIVRVGRQHDLHLPFESRGD